MKVLHAFFCYSPTLALRPVVWRRFNLPLHLFWSREKSLATQTRKIANVLNGEVAKWRALSKTKHVGVNGFFVLFFSRKGKGSRRSALHVENGEAKVRSCNTLVWLRKCCGSVYHFLHLSTNPERVTHWPGSVLLKEKCNKPTGLLMLKKAEK